MREVFDIEAGSLSQRWVVIGTDADGLEIAVAEDSQEFADIMAADAAEYARIEKLARKTGKEQGTIWG
jgi:hypothetical protein